KPSNILLSPRGPQVIDFGIARAVEGTVLTRTGQSFGTPSYVSPEQVLGQETTRASDVFSLAGAVVFAATGRAPFGSGRAAEILPRVVSLDPRLDGVPESLRPLLTRCLAKDPAERPTADEIGRVLSEQPLPSAEHGWLPAPVGRVIDGHRQEAEQAVLAAPGVPLPAAESGGAGRRRTGLIAVAAGAAVLLLVAGVGLTVLSPWSSDDTGAADGSGEAATTEEGTDEDDAEESTGIDGSVHSLDFTPGGEALYVQTATELTRWDWESGELLDRHGTAPNNIDIADDGTLVTSHQRTVVVRDPDFESIGSFDHAEEEESDILFHDAASINPDGSLVALVVVTHDQDSRLYVWDPQEDTVLLSEELEDRVLSTTFDRTGDLLMLAHADVYPRVRVYDLDDTDGFEPMVSGPEHAPEDEFDFQIYPSALSPTEDLLAIYMDRHVLLYDMEERENLHEIPVGPLVGGLVFSPDGSVLYGTGSATGTGEESGGRVWDVASGEELSAGHTLIDDRVAPHPDGELLVTVDGQTLLVLNAATLDLVREIG
ncbi:protein kinase family protein, partial [Nocardiopsis sp. MG754419]|uniref:protein kinase family protein n=1 Tax=Nocardiopsis sp. MG754419 TaxID=2259865 RepID=UPI001BAB1682